jgi:hypothetical protein
MSEHKENLLHRFLRQADHELSQLLHQKTMPLFVAGPERLLGHFKKITHYGDNIVSQIHGNYEEASKDELRKLLVPHLADWEQLRQRNLLKRLDESEGKKKLAVGVKEAWKQAMRKNGRLLVVEKNYSYPAIKSIDPEVLEGVAEPYNKFSEIKDAVDDIIEKVLINGGDIEFVDAPLLQHHQHIVLEQFY